MSRSAFWIPALVLAQAVAIACPAPARADEPGPTAANRSAAEELFEAARRDLRGGRTADACPKLEESQRLDPGVGTLLHLGECYERLGRTASAWTAFREATPLARQNGDGKRERLAQERADALFPRLARVLIDVAADARTTGLSLALDGAPLGEARWGVAIPVDPGPHRVRVFAAGFRERTVDVVAEPMKTSILTIPSLDRADVAAPTSALAVATPPPRPPPSPQPPPPVGAPSSARGWSTLAIVGAAGSGVSLALSGVFGVRAYRAWNESRPYCDADNACDPPGLTAIDRAKGSATIATTLLATGVVLGATTAVLVLSSSPKQPRIALGASSLTFALGWR